ncbi:SpoIIE family protein phosphatase [Paenibacillus chartarius]|uniref:SpoIIE family protein phosphatase n=1 Tax=Paenibacillus chartarius TaxID=747481 RepID=A0ABV6DPH3_9BACL
MAVVNRPMQGGGADAYGVKRCDDGTWLITVVDGLGHGARGAEAAHTYLRLFRECSCDSLSALMSAIHLGMRATVGAACMIVQVIPDRQQLLYAGIGNVSLALISSSGFRRAQSARGIVGYRQVRIREDVLAWTPGDRLMLHTDGIALPPEGAESLRYGDPIVSAKETAAAYATGKDDALVLVCTLEHLEAVRIEEEQHA